MNKTKGTMYIFTLLPPWGPHWQLPMSYRLGLHATILSILLVDTRRKRYQKACKAQYRVGQVDPRDILWRRFVQLKVQFHTIPWRISKLYGVCLASFYTDQSVSLDRWPCRARRYRLDPTNDHSRITTWWEGPIASLPNHPVQTHPKIWQGDCLLSW